MLFFSLAEDEVYDRDPSGHPQCWQFLRIQIDGLHIDRLW
jgi:hypothetical protein